jgi:hypothetical protein
MVTPEELTARGLRAYEVGRLLAACRVALVVVPLAALCLVERTGREMCACAGVLLLGAAVWLRWRDRRGMEAVRTGLIAGCIPLAAGLILDRFGLRCGLAGVESFCSLLGVLFGVGSGAMISLTHRRAAARASSLVTAGAIAGLAAALGCVRLGVLGVSSMLAAMVAGSVVSAVVVRRRA